MSAGQSIKVSIAGRNYPLTVSAKEEEYIRKAASQINDIILSFQENYAVKDKQDLLAMAALQIASKAMMAESDNKLSQVNAELENINQRLDLFIQEHTS